MFFKEVELKDGNLLQFVGVHVVKWGKTDKPTIGFRVASDKEIIKYLQSEGYEVNMKSRGNNMNKLEKLVREARAKVKEAENIVDTAIEELKYQADIDILEEVGLKLEDTWGQISQFIKERL